ncbi:MAG TPA: DUF308 domain-containing protein [Candidatus Saccharimonadales bacterium]|jgi:uncharacterized membrane protein HdeD (DUF308 family)|nr:DUF308 domain-containing protein [Candidatus Saccharimonadales bacterium]
MAKKSISKNLNDAMKMQALLTVAFGVTVIFWPGITSLVLLYLVGAYLLLSGITHVGAAITNMNSTWWILAPLLGAAELGFGVYLLRHTSLLFSTFVTLIGFILIIRGLIELVSTVFEGFGDEVADRVSLLNGFLALVAGIIVLYQTKATSLAFVWVLGVYGLIVGATQLALAKKFSE